MDYHLMPVMPNEDNQLEEYFCMPLYYDDQWLNCSQVLGTQVLFTYISISDTTGLYCGQQEISWLSDGIDVEGPMVLLRYQVLRSQLQKKVLDVTDIQ